MLFKTLYAFILRDLRQTLSYRFAFVLDLASIFFNAATFYFVAKLFDSGSSSYLNSYGGAYFPFVLIGIAFSTYQTVGLTSFSQNLRQEQYLGTMESVLVSPIKIPVWLTGSALWDFCYATFEVIFYFLISIFFFGLILPNANLFTGVAALVLTLVTFMGLGILAAAFILRFKKGNPVTWAIATASELLGGVYFPIDVLPDWLKKVADWTPMMHALTALRQSLLNGAGFDVVGDHLLFLAVFSLAVWPLGLLAFRWALIKSQEDGTLGHY